MERYLSGVLRCTGYTASASGCTSLILDTKVCYVFRRDTATLWIGTAHFSTMSQQSNFLVLLESQQSHSLTHDYFANALIVNQRLDALAEDVPNNVM